MMRRRATRQVLLVSFLIIEGPRPPARTLARGAQAPAPGARTRRRRPPAAAAQPRPAAVNRFPLPHLQGFRLVFCFRENPFFTDSELVGGVLCLLGGVLLRWRRVQPGCAAAAAGAAGMHTQPGACLRSLLSSHD